MDRRTETEEILREIGDEEAIFFDGFEDAIIGLGSQQHKGPFVIYDRARCIQILVDREGMSPEDAEEFFQFNTEGCWAGDRTPIIVTRLERE